MSIGRMHVPISIVMETVTKDAEGFTYLVDLTAVDWKERDPRFDVLLLLHSFSRGQERLRLKVAVGEIRNSTNAASTGNCPSEW